MSFSLGFIGFGEAAYNMGKGLKSEGLEDIKAYDVVMDKEGPMRDTVLKRCEDAKIKPVFSAKELVENSDFVVIAVPARFTASTADGLIKFARAGQLFADVTTALPRYDKYVQSYTNLYCGILAICLPVSSNPILHYATFVWCSSPQALIPQ